MKYNEGSFFERFKDEQYKARFFLVVFVAIVLFMMIFIRINASSYNKLKKEERNKEVNNKTDEEESFNDSSNPLANKFIYLLLNNYEFNYDITFGEDKIMSSGKKYSDKMLFNFDFNNENVIFFVDNNQVKSNSKEGESSRFPFFFINYYDTKTIIEIVSNSNYSEEDNLYHISNETLYRLGDKDFTNFMLNNSDYDNTIELREIDGKVVGIKMDFSNLFKSSEMKLNTVIFDLNYSNFGFVEDFEAPF